MAAIYRNNLYIANIELRFICATCNLEGNMVNVR
jgi:hypothetical protein